MNTEISIIVPVYNSEHLLTKCVDSILAQTFNSFELILVNDGSTDKSGDLCDEYARQDSRVKVIHKENGGVASSRNAGLEVAKGNFIGFVDNDDYINQFMFETLHNHAVNYSSDIVVCDYIKVDVEQYYNTRKQDLNFRVQHYNNIEALNQLYTTNNITFVVPWNKLYKKHLFEDIKYKVGSINDDETVVHKLLYNSKKITYIHAGLYYYVQRKESQTGTFHIKRTDIIYALKSRELFFREKKELELHQKALKHYMVKFFWYYHMAKNLTGVDEELKMLKRTFDKSLIYLLRHQEISWKQKLMCVVLSVSPSLFNFVEIICKRGKRSQRKKA